jgi:ribose transport system permease protein
MNSSGRGGATARFLSDYGMLPVLLLLCVLFSVLTLKEQAVTGVDGARQLFQVLALEPGGEHSYVVVAGGSADELEFAGSFARLGEERGWTLEVISGDPSSIRAALIALDSGSIEYDRIVTTSAYRPVVLQVVSELRSLHSVIIVSPSSRRWPTFLLAENLRNVANQITVIAIIAIGMTMVIVAGGIDLSVGSLIALSAVVIARVIGFLGGASVSAVGVLWAVLTALAVCAAIGCFSGWMITSFRIPPFIATLAMMQVAAGVAYIISKGKPIYQLPEDFVWLGRGIDPVAHLPVAVLLMLSLYVMAWVLMERTTFGRYLYAVGGNAEAARLAGIRVKSVLVAAYALCALLAGLGGIIMASQLKSGAPTYGLSYELYVIAAVVVGGTSLSGGEGKIIGTLIGAFVIAVIQNGMNLTQIESYTQKVVLGLVILAAVLFDRLKSKGLSRGLAWLKSGS